MNGKGKVNEEIILARWIEEENIREFTIADYYELLGKEDKESLANFVYFRLYGRYIKPFDFEGDLYIQQYKNGFAIMANCCLLIETLQSFKKGWEDTKNKSEKAFKEFLDEEKGFVEFRKINFYKDIRCGILHQGEVTGGYKIRRDRKLFDKSTKTINSVLFANELNQSLKDYKASLKNADWESELWSNFRQKMKAVISNCEE